MDREAELQRIAAERLAAEREAEAIMRRAMWKALLGCVLSCAAGLAIMFFAFRVNDRELGLVFLWSGMIVGYAGMATTLLIAYREGVERGDW